MGIEYLTQTQVDPDETTQTVLNDMREAIRRADIVISGLLDFSAPSRLSLQPCHINDIVEQSLGFVKHELTLKHIVVETALDDTVPIQKLDRNKFKQVLVNVFMNSIQAMSDGGRLTVRTSLRDSEGAPDAREVVLECDDNGPGIPETKINRVFDPFFTTKPVGKGSGLGLSVTRQIVEMHGGTIGLRNRKEGGVRVIISLKV
jgi:signal transduction histidine kinase